MVTKIQKWRTDSIVVKSGGGGKFYNISTKKRLCVDCMAMAYPRQNNASSHPIDQ